jgi:hypothetical protein
VYSLLLQLYGFVSFYTQLCSILFIYWSSPLLVERLLIIICESRDLDRPTVTVTMNKYTVTVTVTVTVTMTVLSVVKPVLHVRFLHHT